MTGTDSTGDRIAQFTAEVAELKLKTGGGAAEKTAGRLGIVMMIVSLVLGFGSYVQSTNTDNALDQTELVILGFACVSMAVVGAALFVWTRLVSFWRFWMLRQMYEHQSHINQLLDRPDR